ncbi:GlsB/YeaQ/YmgE family stress response membrane protein [Actinoallomurus purpureus]|uniref:GlsB/YeaQ/YmgE family stress response membrane protein n=1 Tax=Actinoallomurus purpureus TaxID=478114 RepID=UPI002093D79F|nr:GlsB/YeaQ/YmgE family stress response membrane protein [Actinoallomurus purpureus]MCO6009499.1 GlsB/YeaQ/YmgE family stress response membrane protein [Actinoallomurus purpureus]
MLMTILWFVIIGAIIGALARLVVPGRNPMGIALTILIGIVGAVIGGVIANVLGAGSIIAFIIAVLVAVAGVVLVSGRGRWGSRRGAL